MSLIPSESSSFADLLGRGLDGSKKSKWREPVPEPPKLPDPPQSPARSPVLKEKSQSQQVAGKAPKAPASKKEAKKPLAPLIKKEPVSLPLPVVLEPLPPAIIEPELKEEPVSPLIPPVALLPIQEPAAPEPVTLIEPLQPLEPVRQEPTIKAPLVIQPEDEPPRRPIPIVRVARSKQDPHGDGRGMAVETNGHDISPSPSSPSPSPAAVVFPPAAPRLRPKILMRPRLEEEQLARQPLAPVPAEQIETPHNFAPISPPAMSAEPDPIKSDPWEEEAAWTSERRPRLRFQIQWGSRLVRCLTYEAVAILVLLGAVLVGLAHRAPDDPLNLLTRVLAIGAAIMAALIPVLFYGLPERFPRDPR